MRFPVLLTLSFALALTACGEEKDGPVAELDVVLRGAEAPGAGSAGGGIRLVRVGRFSQPIYVTAPPGDQRRLFVVERAGRIRVMEDGRTLARPFLDLSASVRTDGERGLLSLAFAPDYAGTGRFYVYFTDRRGDIRVREYRRSSRTANRADASTRRDLIVQRHRAYSNHNGGHLAFGPDGFLYISTGDGGGGNDPLRSGQSRGTLLGKLLRIDPRPSGRRPYRTPGSNPFDGRRGRDEIYAYGLRNPFRFSFDRASGDLTIGDVGQDQIEEIDFARAGRARGDNYGWRCFEGRRRAASCSAPGHVPPVLQRRHPENCSIVGGYVVRDPALAGLRGRYVYGDLCNSRLRSARLRPGQASGDSALGLRVSSLVSFGEDAQRRVYAVSIAGPVYRLSPR
jgi:hypothetical protein